MQGAAFWPWGWVSSTVDGGRRDTVWTFESLKEYVGHRVYKTECFAWKNSKAGENTVPPIGAPALPPQCYQGPCHWAGGMAGGWSETP